MEKTHVGGLGNLAEDDQSDEDLDEGEDEACCGACEDGHPEDCEANEGELGEASRRGAIWVGWLGNAKGAPGLPGDVFTAPSAHWKPKQDTKTASSMNTSPTTNTTSPIQVGAITARISV